MQDIKLQFDSQFDGLTCLSKKNCKWHHQPCCQSESFLGHESILAVTHWCLLTHSCSSLLDSKQTEHHSWPAIARGQTSTRRSKQLPCRFHNTLWQKRATQRHLNHRERKQQYDFGIFLQLQPVTIKQPWGNLWLETRRVSQWTNIDMLIPPSPLMLYIFPELRCKIQQHFSPFTGMQGC